MKYIIRLVDNGEEMAEVYTDPQKALDRLHALFETNGIDITDPDTPGLYLSGFISERGADDEGKYDPTEKLAHFATLVVQGAQVADAYAEVKELLARPVTLQNYIFEKSGAFDK